MLRSAIKKRVLLIFIILLFFCYTAHSETSKSGENKPYHTANMSELNTAFDADYLNSLEKAIIFEMNKARTNPKEYAELNIKPMLKKFVGKRYFHDNKTYHTKEGKHAVEECLKYLNTVKPRGVLYPDKDLSRAAIDHVRDQGISGNIGHAGSDQSTPTLRVKRYARRDYVFIGENISYGLNSPSEIVSFLLINDGMPSRKHREILMNPKINYTGVACGHHKTYKIMCVMVYGKN